VCLHTRRDAIVGMRDLFGVIRMELRVKPPTLINPRSKICGVVQLHVCVYFFVSLLNNKKNKIKRNFLKSFGISLKEKMLKKRS
jgi:formaldehyde-activating enzyme involved in methanogenesis